MLRVINFSHPVSQTQLEQIARLTNKQPEDVSVITIPVQVDQTSELAEQVVKFVDNANLTSEQWQTEEFVICLPGLTDAGACVLSEVHGRCGYFPRIVNRRQKDGVFAVSEVINLQGVRDQARTRRFSPAPTE